MSTGRGSLVAEQSAEAIALLDQRVLPSAWAPVMRRGLAWWLRDPGATAAWWHDGARGLPITVGDRGARGPWTTSAGTMFGAMAVDEALRLKVDASQWLSMPRVARAVGPMLSRLTRALDPVVNIGTFATSTYLHEHDDADLVRGAADSARQSWPAHALVVRSLDEVRTPNVLAALRRDGWLLVPSRQIWYYHTHDADAVAREITRRRDTRYDQRLLDRTTLERRALVPSDADAVVALYRQLYLGKYSAWNPDVHADAVRVMLECGGLSGEGFAMHGTLVAIAAFFDAPGVMTTPIIGYDLELPRTLGLYRLLSMIILQRAQARGVLLHASAGADEFKMLRGAVPTLEYIAVDARSASRMSRAMWQVCASQATSMAPRVFPHVFAASRESNT